MTATRTRADMIDAPSECPLPGVDRCPHCDSEWIGPVLVPALDPSRYHCWEGECPSRGAPWDRGSSR